MSAARRFASGAQDTRCREPKLGLRARGAQVRRPPPRSLCSRAPRAVRRGFDPPVWPRGKRVPLVPMVASRSLPSWFCGQADSLRLRLASLALLPSRLTTALPLHHVRLHQ